MTDNGSAGRDTLQQRLLSLRKTIDHALQPLIRRGAPVAHVDFPNHPNVGDSAIWLGEVRWLADNGNSRRYVCDIDTYQPHVLRRRFPEGPILLHGGGNFGDLWPRHQQFREAVIRDFPDRQIVQLPQTMHFENPVALAEAQRVYNTHDNLTLLVRDHRSYALASEAFRPKVVLCPDMAFCLPIRLALRRGPAEVVYLKRTDKEASDSSHPVRLPPNAIVIDWRNEPQDLRWRFSMLFKTAWVRYPNRLAPFAPWLADTIAGWRLKRGIDLLAGGQSVVTDRLHAHILCLLLGIPHTVIDNSYGKLSSFIDTWTAGTCEVSW